jgi:hypothetical protein
LALDPLEVHTRLLRRLCIQNRDDQRSHQFAMEIPATPEAQQLREGLSRALRHWASRRVANQPHPDGEREVFVWGWFDDFIRKAYTVTPTMSQQEAALGRRLLSHLDDVRLQSGRMPFAVRKFAPLGRGVEPPEGPWIWLLRFDSSRHEGRLSTDNFAESVKAGPTDLFGSLLLLRRDRAPADALERMLYTTR